MQPCNVAAAGSRCRMTESITHAQSLQVLRSAGIAFVMTLASLAAIEVALRLADLRILREASSERSLSYRYDAELGWIPIPNSSSVVTTARSVQAKHNSLGF